MARFPFDVVFLLIGVSATRFSDTGDERAAVDDCIVEFGENRLSKLNENINRVMKELKHLKCASDVNDNIMRSTSEINLITNMHSGIVTKGELLETETTFNNNNNNTYAMRPASPLLST